MSNITFKANQVEEAKVLVGKKIRAYDNKPVRVNGQPVPEYPDAYVEGIVTRLATVDNHGLPYNAYVIEVTHDSCYWGKGNQDRVGLVVFVPMQVSSEYEGRVQLIEDSSPRKRTLALIEEAQAEARAEAKVIGKRNGMPVTKERGIEIRYYDDFNKNNPRVHLYLDGWPTKKQLKKAVEDLVAAGATQVWVEGRIDMVVSMLDYSKYDNYEPGEYWEVDLYADGTNLIY